MLILVKSRYKFSDVTECKPMHKCDFRFLIDLYLLCQENWTPSVHAEGPKASFFRSSWPYYGTWHWTATGHQLGQFINSEKSHTVLAHHMKNEVRKAVVNKYVIETKQYVICDRLIGHF